MAEGDQLKRVIAYLEARRLDLGEDIVQVASAALHKRLTDLNLPKPGASRREPDLRSVFVGRKAEFSAVERRLECLAKEGQGRFVSILGEAGIGKSRLVAELHNHVCALKASFPIQWLEASAASMTKVASYWLFRQIIWQYAAITEQDAADYARRKLRNRLEALFDEESAEVFPYLATMMALPVKDEYAEQIRYLDGEAVRRQVFFASRRVFERIARSQPVVLVLEDLQWIDESSAVLLQHLIPLIYRVPLLMLGVSRPTVGTPYSRLTEVMTTVYHDRYDEIRLSPLLPTDAAKLVANLVPDQGFAPLLTNKVVDKTGGNPFFIEEIVRSLVHERPVRADSSSHEWQPADDPETIDVPQTIQDVIMARVDLLDESLKEIVKMAAVVGRRFLYRVLLVVAHPAPELLEHLEMLERLGLILRDTDASELTFMFNHDLTHEVIYENIDPSDRKALHLAAAEAIERLFSDRLEEFFSLLAYHYSRAEAWEKAQDYLFKAGDQSGFVAADAEALAYYTEAKQAYFLVFGDRWSPLQRASLERKMGEAFFRRVEYEQALEYLNRSMAYLGKSLPTSRIGIWLRLFRELAGQIWNRIRPGRSPEETVPSEVTEEIRIHELMCWIYSFNDVERFLLNALAMINVSERAGSGYGMALGFTGCGISSDFMSLFRLADHYHGLALSAADRAAHPVAMGYALMGSAIHSSTVAEWNQTVDSCEKAVTLFRRAGDLHNWAYIAHVHCCVLAYRGDYGRALTSCREIMQRAEDGGDPEAVCWGKWNEGYVLVRLGRFQEATQSLEESKELARSAGNPIYEVASSHELALMDLRQQRLEMALTRVEELERMVMEWTITQYLFVPSHNAVTQAYLQKAEQSGKARRDTWMQRARLACQRGLKQSKACYLVRPEALRLQGVYQWIAGKPKSARECWKQALQIAEQTDQRYDVAAILHEMGNRLQDRACLDRSERICALLGVRL